MNKNIFTVITLAALAVAVALGGIFFFGTTSVQASGPGWNQNTTTTTGRGYRGTANGSQMAGTSLTPLTDAEASALQRAIVEEYTAQALYQSVLDQFGNVAPFNTIVVSEGQHIAALTRLANLYGVSLPASVDPASLPTFSTLEEAYDAGVQAEITDAALYDTLKPVVTHANILQVFNNLQSASLNSHLPAFEAYQ